MRLIKRLTASEFLEAFVAGNEVGTSFTKRDTDTQEFAACARCGRAFYAPASAMIFYDLCDPCFTEWNFWNITSRLNGGPHNVPIERVPTTPAGQPK